LRLDHDDLLRLVVVQVWQYPVLPGADSVEPKGAVGAVGGDHTSDSNRRLHAGRQSTHLQRRREISIVSFKLHGESDAAHLQRSECVSAVSMADSRDGRALCSERYRQTVLLRRDGCCCLPVGRSVV
jgi:hypothetical protein